MKTNILPWLWMVVALLLLPQSASAAIRLHHFEADSYQKILELHQNDAFLMVLWSLDCPPCIDELVTLGEFHRQHPAARLVLVSTDSLAQEKEITELMRLYGLHDVQQWVFDGDSVQALRYAIDPLWYGELPRSYFYKADHQRQARSGRLDDNTLLAWYQTTYNVKKGLQP